LQGRAALTVEVTRPHLGWRRVDPDDPLTLTLTLLPKYVVSSTLQTTEWHNSQLVRGDVLEELVKLKSGHYGEIQIQGSAQLAQTLIAHDIIDEYRLWFFPVVRGSGKRLFSNGGVPLTLTLVDTQTTSTGVVIHTYRRVGPRKDGLFLVDRIQCDDVANRARIATNARL
jgi:dihydrofolate reductase